jgi:hypothetical protein
MEVRVAVLADAANIAPPEKLNILGAFDTIASSRFPCVHPVMALVLRLKLDHEDGNRTHVMKVTLRDDDGRVVLEADARLQVGPVPAGEFGHMNQILNFAGVQFAKPGHYAFELSWNGHSKARVDLKVLQAPGQTPAQEPPLA